MIVSAGWRVRWCRPSAAPVLDEGKWSEEEDDGKRPQQRPDDPVLGRLAQKLLSCTALSQSPHGVNHIGNRLMRGEPLQPARHRADRDVSAGDECKGKDDQLYVGAYAFEDSLGVSSPTGEDLPPEKILEMFRGYVLSLPEGRFPHTRGAADLLFSGSPDERYEFGIDLMLRGLETYAGESPPS